MCCSIGRVRPAPRYRPRRCTDRSLLWRSDPTLAPTRSCKWRHTSYTSTRLRDRFSASLAGLLWRNILDQKGFHITLREFIKWNTVPVIVTMIVGCLVVVAEVCVMYR